MVILVSQYEDIIELLTAPTHVLTSQITLKLWVCIQVEPLVPKTELDRGRQMVKQCSKCTLEMNS